MPFSYSNVRDVNYYYQIHQGKSLKSLNELLIFAAKQYNSDEVNEIIALVQLGANAEIEATDKEGYTALMHACWAGNIKIASFLISKGAHVEVKYKYGMSLFEFCSQHGYVEIVALLLERGVKAGIDNALGLAASQGHLKVVELLINHGANPNSFSPSLEHTPLMWAIRNNDILFFECLIKLGADPHQVDYWGDTILMYTVDKSNDRQNGKTYLEWIKLLITKYKVDVNAIGSKGKTTLMRAYDLEVVNLLIENGAKINSVDSEGNTALMTYCANVPNVYVVVDMLKIIECFIKYDTNILLVNNQNQTAVMQLINFPTRKEVLIYRLLCEMTVEQRKALAALGEQHKNHVDSFELKLKANLNTIKAHISHEVDGVIPVLFKKVCLLNEMLSKDMVGQISHFILELTLPEHFKKYFANEQNDCWYLHRLSTDISIALEERAQKIYEERLQQPAVLFLGNNNKNKRKAEDELRDRSEIKKLKSEENMDEDEGFSKKNNFCYQQ